MSHYTVGVIIKEEDVKGMQELYKYMPKERIIKDLVENAMAPFDENMPGEPTLAMTLEELKESFDEVVNYQGDVDYKIELAEKYADATLEEFCENYHGYEFQEDGAYSTYNDDSKWDWYVIGGRWNGCLPIKDIAMNENELEDSYTDDINHNCCKIKDLKLRREATEEELVEIKERYEELTTKGNWFKPEYYKAKYPTLESYIDNELEFATYALLNSKGEWIEPGEMGWFGISSASPEEEAAFANTFRKELEKENSENYFVLVDCHI